MDGSGRDCYETRRHRRQSMQNNDVMEWGAGQSKHLLGICLVSFPPSHIFLLVMWPAGDSIYPRLILSPFNNNGLLIMI